MFILRDSISRAETATTAIIYLCTGQKKTNKKQNLTPNCLRNKLSIFKQLKQESDNETVIY